MLVAKDTKRNAAAVVVSRGSVRTVRTPNKFRHLRVGQRVAANARKLSDGTYVAAAVRGQGRVSRVRFRGVVVRQDRRAGRLILSAGKSVFAARMTVMSPSTVTSARARSRLTRSTRSAARICSSWRGSSRTRPSSASTSGSTT